MIALAGRGGRARQERLIRSIFTSAALITLLISAFIIETVLARAVEFLSQIDLAQLVGIGWFPRRGIFDVSTLLFGSLIVTGIAMMIAAPIGLAAAIYLSEYASPRARSLAKPILEAFCKTVTHLGPTGAGQAAKAVKFAIDPPLARMPLVPVGKPRSSRIQSSTTSSSTAVPLPPAQDEAMAL